MSSVAVFRKEEIDEKSFLVCTLTHTNNPISSGEALTMDSGDNLSIQPLFLCPQTRMEFQYLNQKNDDDECELLPFTASPLFPRSGDQQGQNLLDSYDESICKLPLSWCNNKKPSSIKVYCRSCRYYVNSVGYYACHTCRSTFHKECVESPLEIKHPSHPFHSLRLYNCRNVNTKCISCKKVIFDTCYHCTTCDLTMDPFCALEPIIFVVDNPKSHSHPLTFFPTQASLVCQFCAEIKNLDPTYICIQCVFVIHKGCMGFPHVIRISRHPHRISFTSSQPSGLLTCGVCHKHVDNNYGAYSCNTCDAYFVHSKCALLKNVWDGKELEGVPEEADRIDDGEPFERISHGIILHPFHSHYLRLEIFRAYDEDKYCQGCALPIYEGQFYSCMECDYILHESCAKTPRQIRHPLRADPLTLQTIGFGVYGIILQCNACRRDIAGFHYTTYFGDHRSIWIDLRCASIMEPFEYQGHKHPLFLTAEPEKMARCQVCKEESENLKLYCMDCEYTLCFRCATLPWKVRYKHDNHFLTICDGEDASEQPDWCEICERKIEVKVRENYRDKKKERQLYKCHDCCTTLHVECLLGVDIYLKSGQTINDQISCSETNKRIDVHILLNNSLSRPTCDGCYRRCPFPIYFKALNRVFCCWRCTEDAKH